MQLADFDFILPPELIAQEPVEPRDASRLLVYTRETDQIEHFHVRDLPQLLPQHTVLVRNDSKVRHGRLFDITGREILIVKKDGNTFHAMIRGKQPKVGQVFHITKNFTATVEGLHEGPGMTTTILTLAGEADPEILIERYGHVPLPPYIHDSHAPSSRYQTVYAHQIGSAAAPTAGLHFTPELIANLEKAGHVWETVTLHVGLGTFLPLRKDTIEANQLHHEETTIDETVASHLTKTINLHQPLLAVGTTSLRTLESHWMNDAMAPGNLSTDLYIYPGKPVNTANLMFTNFHLPKSSLLLLVAAFLAMDVHRHQRSLKPQEAAKLLQKIYTTAIAEKYRFFSFGDAMLIR